MRRLRAAALAAGLLWIALPAKSPLNPYDEGLALVGGMRVLHGEVPFRDFWTIYPPGQAYAIAAVFRAAGETVLAARVYDTILRGLLALLLYLLAARMLRSRDLALLPYGTAALLLASAFNYGYPVFPALLFGFAAIEVGLRGAGGGSARWPIGAGFLAGIAALFRIDIGAYAGCALLATLALRRLGGGGEGARFGGRGPGFLAEAGKAVGAALLATVPLYAWLGSKAGFDRLAENLLLFPLTTFREVRHLPLPPLVESFDSIAAVFDARSPRMPAASLRFYLPIAAIGLSAILVARSIARSLRDRTPLASEDRACAALAVFGLGLLLQAESRYDAIHVLPVSLVAVLLLAGLLRRLPWRRPWAAVLGAALVGVSAIPYLLLPGALLVREVRERSPLGCFSELSRAGCVPTLAGQEALVRTLDRLDPTRGPLLVLLPRHDRVFAIDASIYFLAGRPVATRYHELHPGVATTNRVQEEIVRELIDRDLERIVLLQWGNPGEPNASRLSSGVDLLDRTVRARYVPERTVGMYEIWRRRDGARAGGEAPFGRGS